MIAFRRCMTLTLTLSLNCLRRITWSHSDVIIAWPLADEFPLLQVIGSCSPCLPISRWRPSYSSLSSTVCRAYFTTNSNSRSSKDKFQPPYKSSATMHFQCCLNDVSQWKCSADVFLLQVCVFDTPSISPQNTNPSQSRDNRKEPSRPKAIIIADIAAQLADTLPLGRWRPIAAYVRRLKVAQVYASCVVFSWEINSYVVADARLRPMRIRPRSTAEPSSFPIDSLTLHGQQLPHRISTQLHPKRCRWLYINFQEQT